jgi:PKHD-type hydroxylase
MLTTKVQVRNKMMYPYICEDSAFNHVDLQKVIDVCEAAQLEDSKTVNGDKNNNIRISKSAFIHLDSVNSWVFYKLLDVMEAANREFFGFDLIGFDYFQYTVYDKKGSHYDFHTDYLFNTVEPESPYNHLSRKLSVTFCLSDEDEFQGGEFEIMTSATNKHVVPQKKGRMIFFPSFAMHRIAPIKKGVRKSIVIWGLGPALR